MVLNEGKSVKVLYILFIIFIITSSSGICQQKIDTNFILRQNTKYYHAIFIDTNKNSSFYADLKTNKFSPFNSLFYLEGIQQLKDNKIKITKHKISNFNLNWHPLYLYKGGYYVYIPSDGMYNNWLSISDSIFLYYAGGEMVSNAINDFKKIKNNEFQFDLTEISGNRRKVKVYIIDQNLGIAVFEFIEGDGKVKYELRVASNKIRNFPIIVNYCLEEKQNEYKFDEPNFNIILSSYMKSTIHF